MLRSLLLAALALLLAVPALAQNTATFQFVGFSETVSVEGLTAVIYSDDPAAEPVERVLGADGIATLENIPEGVYRAYLAPNDQAFVRSSPGLVVDSTDTDFWRGPVVGAIDPARGFVQGQVTIASSGNPVRFLDFSLPSEWGNEPYSSAPIDGDGRFAFQLPPGSYDVSLPFSYTFPFPPIEGEYSPVDAAFTVAAGETVSLDLVAEIPNQGVITGRVTDAVTGEPIDAAFVSGYGVGGFGYGYTSTDADGLYELAAPEGPEYIVYAQFADTTGTYYVRQYYDGVGSPAQATLVPVGDGAPTDGVDFALSSPAEDFAVRVQATVVGTDGAPLDAQATIYNRLYGGLDVTLPIVDGVLDFQTDDPLFAGAHVQVSFFKPDYQFEFFDNSPTLDGAQYLYVGAEAVTFSLGEVVLLENGEDEPGLAISGTVASEDGGAPLAGAVVTAQRLDAPGIRYATTDGAGAYRIGGLDAGEYAVLFTSAGHVPEFYPDAAAWAEAERIVLTASRDAVNGLMGGLNRPVGANKDGAPRAAVRSTPPGGAPFVQFGTLSGTVRSADGEALLGALVTATGPDGVEAYGLSDGLGQFSMTVLSGQVTVTADRGRYLAATRTADASGGQMLLTLPAFSSVAGETAPSASSALRVYPNPTRGRLTVRLGAPGADRVAVYDVLGREVLSVTPSATAETVALDAARLAPGRYVVRVLSGDRAESRPLTVLR